VRSNSVAWQVLKFIHQEGPTRTLMIQEALELDRKLIGMVLSRLVKYKFLFRIDKAAQADTGDKTSWIYALRPSHRKIRYQPLSSSERQKRVREKQKVKVASVFSFRGTIRTTESRPLARDS
jgi:hypothetical protein